MVAHVVDGAVAAATDLLAWTFVNPLMPVRWARDLGLLGLDLTPGLRERILAHAEGNPFYLEEILRSLIDQRALVQDPASGHWQAAVEVERILIPDTLVGVLVARIDRLEEQSDCAH